MEILAQVHDNNRGISELDEQSGARQNITAAWVACMSIEEDRRLDLPEAGRERTE